jgi:hypothetical protein
MTLRELLLSTLEKQQIIPDTQNLSTKEAFTQAELISVLNALSSREVKPYLVFFFSNQRCVDFKF